MLFSEYKRTNSDHKRNNQSSFDFLDKSAWPISSFMREKLNEWILDYPFDKDFLNKIKSKDDKQHNAATFELLIYTILKKHNYKPEVHPSLNSSRKPDFKITTQEGGVCIIECSLASNSFNSYKEVKQIEVIESIVEEIDFFPYWIILHIRKISDISISKNKLRKFIFDLGILYDTKELMNVSEHIFNNNGWELEIELLKKNGRIRRSFGAIFNEAKFIDPAKPLLRALNDKKATNYNISDNPYVICLNTSDLFTKNDDFIQSLYGNNFKKEGFFVNGGRAINTTVSAVAFFKNFDIFTLDHSSISIWHNSFAKKPLQQNFLQFDEYYLNEIREMNTVKKDTDIFSILSINKKEYIQLKKMKMDTTWTQR